MGPHQGRDIEAIVAVAQPKALHACDVLLRKLLKALGRKREREKLWRLLLSLTTELHSASTSDKASSHGTSRPTSQTFTQKKTCGGSKHHSVCVCGVNVYVVVK